MQDKTKITEQQLEILKSKSGIKRVIACAGSGKTFVLTKSIIETLREGLCRPDEVLAITFTRNAAENMRQRIKDNLKKKIDFENIDIFTFNSFGNSIISENSLKLSLGKNYKLINISKSWQLIFNIIGSSKFEKIKIGKNLGKFIDDVLKFVWD
ncbi:MAG: UvrD-helicase domain-containing protein, partial [Actinobacteria bacterium]|nr:UvrD-helicase domain-containing protein [Actinomycetota bacterium]